MSSGLRFPLLIPVGVQRIRFSEMRYEWLPSLPAQNPFVQMRRPMSHICSLIFHSLTRVVPFPFDDPLLPYAMTSTFQPPAFIQSAFRVFSSRRSDPESPS